MLGGEWSQFLLSSLSSGLVASAFTIEPDQTTLLSFLLFVLILLFYKIPFGCFFFFKNGVILTVSLSISSSSLLSSILLPIMYFVIKPKKILLGDF